MSTGGGPTKTTVEANVEAKLVEHPTVVEHPTIIAGDLTLLARSAIIFFRNSSALTFKDFLSFLG